MEREERRETASWVKGFIQNDGNVWGLGGGGSYITP